MSWEIFDQSYQKYEGWFDESPGKEIFELEARCLTETFKGAPKPWLEVGVGTGRFAEKLGIAFGVEPSEKMLKKALKRGIRVTKAAGENLPFASNSFGTAALIFTFCFLDNPEQTLKECFRVLKNEGMLILGIIPGDSSWGKLYSKRGAEKNSFYATAHFYTPQVAIALSEKAGFKLQDIFSTLLEESSESTKIGFYPPKKGLSENAGFVCIRMRKP